MLTKAIKFLRKKPAFGRTKKQQAAEPFKKSPYYFWWEYLRRSEAYKKCCERGGKGKLSRLYKDFGDVFNVDFKTWWTTDKRGEKLFGEAPVPKIAAVQITKDFVPLQDAIYVQIPLSLPKCTITKYFKFELDRHHAGKVGIHRTAKTSTARYPIVGVTDINVLQECLNVYDYCKQNELNRDLRLWQIAQAAVKKKQFFLIKDSDDFHEVARKKIYLANVASRYRDKAIEMIKNVENGTFPKML